MSGGDYFGVAMGFLADMRWTGYVSTYGGYSEWTAGWTSSTDEAGLPIAGSVGFGWWPPGGGFVVGAAADEPDGSRGVWLWRPSGGDHSPPAITSSVTGIAGNNGWYVSDVSVTLGRPGPGVGGHLSGRVRPGDRDGRHCGHDVHVRGNVRPAGRRPRRRSSGATPRRRR